MRMKSSDVKIRDVKISISDRFGVVLVVRGW